MLCTFSDLVKKIIGVPCTIIFCDNNDEHLEKMDLSFEEKEEGIHSVFTNLQIEGYELYINKIGDNIYLGVFEYYFGKESSMYYELVEIQHDTQNSEIFIFKPIKSCDVDTIKLIVSYAK